MHRDTKVPEKLPGRNPSASRARTKLRLATSIVNTNFQDFFAFRRLSCLHLEMDGRCKLTRCVPLAKNVAISL